MADITIDAVLEGTCLVVAATDEEDFLGIHDGADTYSKGLLWNEVEIALEEA